ncbi:MAG: helix-turn-helix domain-containing protein [Planctomycetaceae bacterium]|nr:helix-turn-helix domain-containing protein [Planctomycetaceae bacterium]
MDTSGSVQPLAVSEPAAAKCIGISPRTLFTLRQRGEIGFVRIGQRVVYPLAEIKRYLERRQAVCAVSSELSEK